MTIPRRLGRDVGGLTTFQTIQWEGENMDLSPCGKWASSLQLDPQDDSANYYMWLRVINLTTGQMHNEGGAIELDATARPRMLASAFSLDSSVIVGFFDGILLTYKFDRNVAHPIWQHVRGTWIPIGGSDIGTSSGLLDQSTNWKWRLFLSKTGKSLAVFESNESVSLYKREAVPGQANFFDWTKKQSTLGARGASAYWDAAFSPTDENILAVYEEVNFQQALAGDAMHGVRRNAQIKIWNIATDAVMRTINLPTNISIDRSARPFGKMGGAWVLIRYFFPSPIELSRGEINCTVDATDLMTGRVIQQWSFPAQDFQWTCLGSWSHAMFYPWVRIDPDSGRMIVTHYTVRTSEIWDLNTGRRLKTLNRAIQRSGPADFHRVLVEGDSPDLYQVWAIQNGDE